MSKVGKIDVKVFEKFLKKRLGKENKKVLISPETGVDAAVIDIGNDKVLIVAEDPIFPLPRGNLDTFGWYTVHIGASDIAVMGIKPEYMTYTLLMPPDTKKKDFEKIVDSIHQAAKELNISIIGGHTGYYPTVKVPIIGGITVFAISDKNDYITPKGAKIGDKVILTKGPAIEATGILALLNEEKLLEELPKDIVEKAKGQLKNISVVKDALVAKSCGGVTAMHDATEGGVLGGLFEIANASRVGIFIDEREIIYPEEVRLIMDYFGIDPLKAISEGTLIITASPEKTEKIVDKLKKEKIPSSIIGEIVPEDKGRKIIRFDGKKQAIKIPEQDSFWPVFFKLIEEKDKK